MYLQAAGIISALGSGLGATEQILRENRSAIKPLALFTPLHGSPLPAGEVGVDFFDQRDPAALPRTHRLAFAAARQAMADSALLHPPEAVILGTTTGGILTTEQLLKNKSRQKELYQYHGLHSVATCVARECHCTGPALVVSTACSSGVVAIALALQMLRSGLYKTVLAGGVDSLSRLTYFGFHSLQLVDQTGCKPLDQHRQGMAVAEGAGMLLLTTEKPDNYLAEILGAGLSCDAYHPAAPHPDGQGAFTAMQNALTDAGLSPEAISYINLHGTGTPDNDLAEAKAVRRLFSTVPPLSSIKGASGHSLAAAGAIEAIVSTIAIAKWLMPANTGLQHVDPLLGVSPLVKPLEGPVQTVLTNSFGFGGNNGSLVIGAPNGSAPRDASPHVAALAIHGYSCLSGAGDTLSTINQLHAGGSVAGITEIDTLSKNLPSRLVRRLKRLPRMTLSLAVQAHLDSDLTELKPGSVFMGTGWGGLSETHDFLARLAESKEQFPSPTDFVGSVHNGPASQVAIMFGATGPNITTSGGDYSFEQALLAAQLMFDDQDRPALVLGAEEGHETFSPLFDASINTGAALADGGGAFCVNRDRKGAVCCISLPFYKSCEAENVITDLVKTLDARAGRQDYALILAGIPAAMHSQAAPQLEEFTALLQTSAPIVPYRQLTGQFACASAVATALAVSLFASGSIPGTLTGGPDSALTESCHKILVLGLGQYITAIELCRP